MIQLVKTSAWLQHLIGDEAPPSARAVMLNLGRGSLPCDRYALAPLSVSKEGSQGLKVLRAGPTPSRIQVPMDSTPLHFWIGNTQGLRVRTAFAEVFLF